MKPLFVISCPIDTYSGYGARARDLVKAIINQDKYDVRIAPQRWGNTPWGFIEDHKEQWSFLNPHILNGHQVERQPDVWMQITVPNEFQPMGKYNIGVTAGIETTVCDPSWIEGVNRMNLTLVSSNHAKNVFEQTTYEQRDKNTDQAIGQLRVNKPIEVLFEGVDLATYFPIDEDQYVSQITKLDEVEQDFCYLTVGHWMQGDVGEDRKNIGLTVKAFYEIFKDKKNKPALILKTSSVGASYTDRESILSKIHQIRESVRSKDLPRVYLLHGEFSNEEMNNIYNHPKIKALVSLTKGEGFGRPLLEFSVTKKPIITTNWSGHLDFLDPEHCVLLGGEVKQVHPTAAVPNVILQESGWFAVDAGQVGHFMTDVFNNYSKYLSKAKRQYHRSKTKFSMEAMEADLGYILNRNIPEFAAQVQLKLPQLKKIELPKLKKIELPKLKKVEENEKG